MDFFETRERYRKKEYRIYINLVIRVAVLLLVLWIGWQWGNFDQKNLYDNTKNMLDKTQIRLSQLNQNIATLVQENKRLAAENTIYDLDLEDFDKTLSNSIKFLLESDVSLEQIRQYLLAISSPINCRKIADENLAVATELYTGSESSLSLFQGGLRVHIDGAPYSQGNKNNPWFEPDKDIEVRLAYLAYLGGQKIETGKLPLKLVIPAEYWLLKAEITESNLRGYVRIMFEQCSLR